MNLFPKTLDELTASLLESREEVNFRLSEISGVIRELSQSHDDLRSVTRATTYRFFSKDSHRLRSETLFSLSMAVNKLREDAGLPIIDTSAALPQFDAEQFFESAVLGSVVRSIPEQSQIVKFGLEKDVLSLVPSQKVGDDENDYGSIEVFIEEMLEPLGALRKRYLANPNAPHCGVLAAAVEDYAKEISKKSRDINYTLLYARGRKFIRALETSRQQMDNGDWPEFEPQEAADLTLVSDLHGSIMMRSGDGAKLVNEAFVIQATPEEVERERQIYREIGEAVAEASDLLDAEGREFVRDATKIDLNDKQVSRSQFLAFSATTSVLSVVAAGAVYATAGTAGGVAAVAATWIMLEALKKTKGLKKVSEVSADAVDATNDKIAKALEKTDPVVFQRMYDFVRSNHAQLLELAKARKEFSWIEKALTLLAKRKRD